MVGLPLPHDYDALTVLGCVVEERGCLTYGLAPRARWGYRTTASTSPRNALLLQQNTDLQKLGRLRAGRWLRQPRTATRHGEAGERSPRHRYEMHASGL